MQDLLKGQRFPTENTVVGFLTGCGVTGTRPWLAAWRRVKDLQPKDSRVSQGVREQLAEPQAAQQQHEQDLAAALEEIREPQKQVGSLRQQLQGAKQRQRAVLDRLPQSLQFRFRIAPAIQREGTEADGLGSTPVQPERYSGFYVNKAVTTVQELLDARDLPGLDFYLSHQAPFEPLLRNYRRGEYRRRSQGPGHWEGCEGHLAIDVDNAFAALHTEIKALINQRDSPGPAGPPDPPPDRS